MRDHRCYKDCGDFTVAGLAAAVTASGGGDVVVHSLVNAPEVTRPLHRTSRAGYLAAISTSAYSYVALLQQLGADLPPP